MSIFTNKTLNLPTKVGFWLIFSYVAVVIDTDGSAFITKAEFDSLKNNFQSQIDNYNSSIDSKIDGAIASYLAGIKLSSSVAGTSCIYEISRLPLQNLKNYTSWFRYAAHERLCWGMEFTYGNALSYAGLSGQTAYQTEVIVRRGPGKPSPFGFYVTGAGNTDSNIGTNCTPIFDLNAVWTLTMNCMSVSGQYGSLGAYPSASDATWYHGDFFWYPLNAWTKTDFEYAKANHWKKSSTQVYDPNMVRFYNDGKSTTGKYSYINWPLFGFDEDEFFWCWDEGQAQYYQTVGTGFTPNNSTRTSNPEKNPAYVGHVLTTSERKQFWTWAGHPSTTTNYKLSVTSGGSEDLPRFEDNNEEGLYQMSGTIATGKLPVLVTGADAKIPIMFSDLTRTNSRKAYRYSFQDNRNFMRGSDEINSESIKTNVYLSTYGHGPGSDSRRPSAYAKYYNGYSSLDPRVLFPTFGSIESDIDNKGDTVRSASKIKFSLTDLENPASSGAEWTLEKGVPVIHNKENAGKVKFKIKFDSLWGNGTNYQILLKKDSTWDYTKLGNKETVEYKLDGSLSPANNPVQVAPGEYEITLENLNGCKLVYLQWLTNDSWDGGRLISISDVVFDKEA